MPLPPAPSQRASRLSHKAFETSVNEKVSPAIVQVETKPQQMPVAENTTERKTPKSISRSRPSLTERDMPQAREQSPIRTDKVKATPSAARSVPVPSGAMAPASFLCWTPMC
jgi:PhoH-like ATPase